MMPKDGFSKFIWPGNQENQETRVFFLEKSFFCLLGQKTKLKMHSYWREGPQADDDRVKYDENSALAGAEV